MTFGKKIANEQNEANQTLRMEAHMEARRERFGTATLHSPIALQMNISMREAMEFNFPTVRYILDTLVGSLATLATDVGKQ